MPAFEVRSLWNENATQCSNTVERDCVYFCLCVCPSVLWVMQSRSEFRFCLWLKTKNPPVHRMWATWNSALISVQYPVLLFSLFPPSQVSWFYLPCLLFHQSFSGRLQAWSLFHTAQWETPAGFLLGGRNWVRDGPRSPQQWPLWDCRQVMSSTPRRLSQHNTVSADQDAPVPGLGLNWYSSLRHV